MSLTTAFATLAAVNVTGIGKSYTLAQLRGGVNNPDLPCLLPIPYRGDNERSEFGGGNTATYDEYHVVRHRLLERPVEPAIQGEALANVVTLIDNYLAAIAGLTSHSGALDILVTGYEAGTVVWGGLQYYGCDFLVKIWVSD